MALHAFTNRIRYGFGWNTWSHENHEYGFLRVLVQGFGGVAPRGFSRWNHDGLCLGFPSPGSAQGVKDTWLRPEMRFIFLMVIGDEWCQLH